jgi:hypothetical protein
VRDSDYNEIWLYYFTDSPSLKYDGFVHREYNIPKVVPLYICLEVWCWNGREYEKRDSREVIPINIKGDKWAAKVMKEFTFKYLRFMVPTHKFDFSYRGHLYTEKNKNYKHKVEARTTYYNQDYGCRWNRAYLVDDEDDFMDKKYGKLL